MLNLVELNVNLEIPLIDGVKGIWKPNKAEKKAAWELYVELVTRISVAELKPDEGLLREALTSLYSLFPTTRDILRRYGPAVAKQKKDGQLTFGYLAVAVLNGVLRPALAKWHPLLLHHENARDRSTSPIEHERQWRRNEELRGVLNEVRWVLIQYANILATVAKVPSIIVDRPSAE